MCKRGTSTISLLNGLQPNTQIRESCVLRGLSLEGSKWPGIHFAIWLIKLQHSAPNWRILEYVPKIHLWLQQWSLKKTEVHQIKKSSCFLSGALWKTHTFWFCRCFVLHWIVSQQKAGRSFQLIRLQRDLEPGTLHCFSQNYVLPIL